MSKMPTKKKVKFNDNKEFKRYKKETDSDQSEEDYANQSDEELSKKKGKHSLDSDEEDNTDKYEILNRDALNDIGQEAKTSEFDDEIKLTPFNMKEELEEGDFDREGYYHWKRDKDELKDAWLDNIDWANINSLKQSKDNMDTDSNKPKTSNEENEEESDESDNESLNDSKEDNSDQIETFKKIFPYLKPGETILKAIKRLGNSSKSAGGAASSLSASQRWLKKKNQSQASSNQNSGQASADKEALEKLTGLANYFIDKGFYDIYEETYDSLEKKIKDSEVKISEKKESFDIFADDVDEQDLKEETNVKTENKTLEDSIVKWIYKTVNTDDAKIFGPFTSQEMLNKSENGEFKDTGVWCRKTDDASSTFYNSKRIDFDLYT